MRPLLSLFVLLLTLGMTAPALAQTASASEAQVAWRLLDYVGVDYAGAVENGQVTNPAEYGEMVEFSSQILTRLEALPSTSSKADLVRDAVALQDAIRNKSDPRTVAGQAKTLAGAVLAAYPSPLAPSFPSTTRNALSATAPQGAPTARARRGSIPLQLHSRTSSAPANAASSAYTR